MVLNIDAENQRLSLGLKQLATDIWDDFFSRHKVGDIVEGKVVRMTNFGAFVELDEGIEGLIHVSEFDDTQGGREGRPPGGQHLPDEGHQAQPVGAEDRPEHPRPEVRRGSGPTGRATRRQQGDGAATLGDHFKIPSSGDRPRRLGVRRGRHGATVSGSRHGRRSPRAPVSA